MRASSLCTPVQCAHGANVPSSLACIDPGIIGLSSYLPLPQLTKDLKLSPAALKTPVFLSRYARLRMLARTRVSSEMACKRACAFDPRVRAPPPRPWALTRRA